MAQRDTEDAEEIEDQDTEKDALALTDPDDYHRSQRLREIHQARRNVHNVVHGDEPPELRELGYAVSLYISELEPLIDAIDADTSLPEHWPWSDILQFADALGMIPNDYDHDTTFAPRPNSIQVFRQCNRILADVKPLIEDDDTDEWEV